MTTHPQNNPFVPFSYRTFFLVPFALGGTTAGGIVTFHHSKLYVIFGRATKVHPTCRNVRPGAWVVYEPNRPIPLTTRDGRLYCLDERLVLGIVEPGDGGTYFEPEQEDVS